MTLPSFRSLHGKEFGMTPRGLEIYGRPLTPTPLLPDTGGDVYYVQSTHTNADDDNDGLSTARPLATLEGGEAKCTANVGDVIVLLPGHSETIITTASLAIAGVTVLGLGSGDDMPQIKFNHADAEISFAANSITMQGVRLSSDITSVAIGLEIEDGVDYTTVRNCKFDVVTTGTDEFTAAVHMVNDNTGTIIRNNYFNMGIAAAVAAVHMDADTDQTQIYGNHIEGDYSTANIVGDTTKSTNLLIDNNLLINGLTGDIGTEPNIELFTASTGVISNNRCVCNLATPDVAIVADTCILFNNDYSETVNQESDDAAVPAADGTGNLLSRDVVGNKSDAAAADGVSTTESLMAYTKQVVGELQTLDAIVDTQVTFQEQTDISATAVMVNGDTIFTVGTAPILVYGLVSECVTLNDATASTLQYSADPTTGAAITFSGASASLADAAAGATVSLIGTALNTAALLGASGVNLGQTAPIVVYPGIITVVIGTGSTTGTWKHRIRWKPLGVGATVA